MCEVALVCLGARCSSFDAPTHSRLELGVEHPSPINYKSDPVEMKGYGKVELRKFRKRLRGILLDPRAFQDTLN